MLAAATLPALFMARRPFAPGLRAVLWASVFYQFTTLVTVVNNPYAANAVEWAHAWMLVAGGLLVGWAVGANGYGRTGVRLLFFTIGLLALITVVEGLIQFAEGDLTPVYPSFPFPMHKNFAGTLCGLGAAMVYARPRWAGLSRPTTIILMTLMIGAMLFTQSRQAVVGLVGAVFVLVLRSNTDRKRSKLTLLLLVPIVVVVTNLVQDQLKSDNQFNSALQRLTWFQDSLTVWSTDPWFGVGLRWWYTDRFPFQFQPPNAEIEVLTSAGVRRTAGVHRAARRLPAGRLEARPRLRLAGGRGARLPHSCRRSSTSTGPPCRARCPSSCSGCASAPSGMPRRGPPSQPGARDAPESKAPVTIA